MHTQFRELLPSATGDSELVIALFLDVRGFSTFSEQVESVEAALYIKRMYERALTFFDDIAFFKPTGDGLLLIFRVDDTSLTSRAKHVVQASISLVEQFGELVAEDPLINFPVPQRVGVGIARGAACRLRSGDITLDYSGRVLNLAARLMDLARPEGVVIDDAFTMNLLSPELQSKFMADEVFIRSVAEKEPRRVHFLSGVTDIPEQNHRPLDKLNWKDERTEFKNLAEFRDSGPNLRYHLKKVPLAAKRITVQFMHPAVTKAGRRHPSLWTFHDVPASRAKYEEEAGSPILGLNLHWMESLLADGVKPSWPLMIRVVYPER
jgi:class 3 adenylate cyclase